MRVAFALRSDRRAQEFLQDQGLRAAERRKLTPRVPAAYCRLRCGGNNRGNDRLRRVGGNSGHKKRAGEAGRGHQEPEAPTTLSRAEEEERNPNGRPRAEEGSAAKNDDGGPTRELLLLQHEPRDRWGVSLLREQQRPHRPRTTTTLATAATTAAAAADARPPAASVRRPPSLRPGGFLLTGREFLLMRGRSPATRNLGLPLSGSS